jgi:DNA-binding transcriptional ArsR family regulator
MSDVATIRPTVDSGVVSGVDYELADEVRADTSTRMKALGDPLRMTILDLVLERAMTVTELAARLRRPKGSVAYHVKVLLDAGLLQVVRTQKVRAIDERYYGRTARTIVFEHPSDEIPFLNDVLAEADLQLPDETVAGGFTYRRARIPRERVEEYVQRLFAITLEFIAEPRGGDIEYGLYVGMFPTNRRIGPVDSDNPQRDEVTT